MTPVHARHTALGGRAGTRLVAALVVVLALAVSMPAAGASAADDLAAAQAEATQVAEELAAIESSLALLEDEIAALESELEEANRIVESLREEVRRIAVQRYVNAGSGDSILDVDPLEYQRLDVMMSAVQADSRETLTTYEDASRRLRLSSGALEDRLAEQQEAQQRLSAVLVDLNEELARLTELARLAELEAARIEAERRQTEARRQAAAVAARTTTTARPVATTAPEVTSTTAATSSTSSTTTASSTTTTTTTRSAGGSGSIVCPVDGVSVFTDTYGAPRSGGRSHAGVDLLAAVGTPAVAPVSGVVLHRWNDLGGRTYQLDGDHGTFYYGAHLSAYGESGRVEAGTVIGYVGDSGNATGVPHLHFEIHPGGRGNPINPYPIVKEACQ